MCALSAVSAVCRLCGVQCSIHTRSVASATSASVLACEKKDGMRIWPSHISSGYYSATEEIVLVCMCLSRCVSLYPLRVCVIVACDPCVA